MRSKARYEKTVAGGAPPTGCLDELCNKAPFVPSLSLHDPSLGAHPKCDRYFSSFAFRTHASAELDGVFIL
jgi:hypothetical protein